MNSFTLDLFRYLKNHLVPIDVYFSLLYLLTSGWVLHTPNTSQNMLSSRFSHENCKKEEKQEDWALLLIRWFWVDVTAKALILPQFSCFVFLFLNFDARNVKSTFQPVFGVGSTQTLVEIFNISPYYFFKSKYCLKYEIKQFAAAITIN